MMSDLFHLPRKRSAAAVELALLLPEGTPCL